MNLSVNNITPTKTATGIVLDREKLSLLEEAPWQGSKWIKALRNALLSFLYPLALSWQTQQMMKINSIKEMIKKLFAAKIGHLGNPIPRNGHSSIRARLERALVGFQTKSPVARLG